MDIYNDIDFILNVDGIGKKFFPEGCTNCKGEVKFLSYLEAFGVDNGRYLYRCESCGAYVPAHNATIGNAVKYHPQGILATAELRSLHELLRNRFNILWRLKKLNLFYYDYILAFDSGGDSRLGVVNSIDADKKTYTLTSSDGKVFVIPIEETRRVSLRTRAYYWLSTVLKLPAGSCQIPLMDTTQTIEAIRVIEEVIKQPTNKDDEN